jgi:acetyl esterase/lipase
MIYDELIDPEVAAQLSELAIADFDLGSVDLSSIPEIRREMAGLPQPGCPPTTAVHEDRQIPGPPGAPEVTIRIYWPTAPGPSRPCVVFIHGGGYMLGSALQDDPRLDRWSAEMGIVIVSVEYRLAPEYPYPAAVDDCYAALSWVVHKSDELEIDPSRIALVGSSAGGGLAAATALVARDGSIVELCALLLIYPMLDDRSLTLSSMMQEAKIWTPGANALGWRAYLGQDPGSGEVPPYAAPARADDLSDLPPTWICVGSLDIFRDEDVGFAQRLCAAGVPTELHLYPGAPHAFEVIAPAAAVSRRCQAEMDGALRRGLGIDETARAASATN